jgi:hypothetical protein
MASGKRHSVAVGTHLHIVAVTAIPKPADPDMVEGVVYRYTLSFDFDGPSLWMQRRMTTPTPVSRGEFGAVAVPRILKLLARRAVPATFFIPGHTIETYPDVCRQVVDAGCEIGLHGYAHELNTTLSPEQEKWVFGRTIELVEQLSGVRPAGYRAPSGDLTEQTISNLVDFGVRYDSSLMGHDYQPYRLRLGDELPDDGPARWGAETPVIELPFSWTLDDYVYLEFVTFRHMLMPACADPRRCSPTSPVTCAGWFVRCATVCARSCSIRRSSAVVTACWRWRTGSTRSAGRGSSSRRWATSPRPSPTVGRSASRTDERTLRRSRAPRP